MKTATKFANNGKSFWEQIDAILIVNLKHRTDRWEQLKGTLASFGIVEKAVRIDAIDGRQLKGYGLPPWFRSTTPDRVAMMKAGSAGCCLSHRRAIALAKERGFKRILLMEDDALFKNPLKHEMGEFLGKFLQSEATWDMLYLGSYRKNCPFSVDRTASIGDEAYSIWRILGPLMLHAVVIHERIYDKLLQGLPTERIIWPWMTYWGSIDSWIQNSFGRKRNVRIYGCRPSLVVQRPNYSDICGRVLSVASSEGTHRKSTSRQLSPEQFEKAIPMTSIEQIYQSVKRNGRKLRACVFGYSKS